MWRDEHYTQFNFRFSQCNLLDETTTTLDISSTHRRKNKKKNQLNDDQIQEQQPTQPMNDLERNVSFLSNFLN
jgi:hypothetical protein